MKCGLVARGESRGLGHLTRGFHDHVHPDRTLLVDMGELARGFARHDGWYPQATVTGFDGVHLDESVVRRWLRGLDVVYVAETGYDSRFFNWCRSLGVRSVLHAMPEFWRYGRHAGDGPDVVWAPTVWRLDTLPEAARLVPVPVDQAMLNPRVRAEPVFLHSVGHTAAADRAGSRFVSAALLRVRGECRVILRTQDQHFTRPRVRDRRVRVEVITGGTERWWEPYAEPSVLIAPRRYGGLSLPFNEAAGAGLGLVLSDVSPNRETWPGVFVPGKTGAGELSTPGGRLRLFSTDVTALADAITRLAASTALIADLSAASLAWAAEHSWEALLPMYLTELDAACA